MTTRRSILAMAALSASGAQSPDERIEPTPSGSDSGSVYPLIEQLAGKGEFSHSFLSTRFSSVSKHRREARRLLLDAFGYRPPAVVPRAEIVHREETPEFTREKIVFSTTPEFRVPAYLHIPKNRKGRVPAIVDLHSHGGMFIFGKEKVIDFGSNHPAMVEYHKANYKGRPTATELARRGYAVITIDAFPFGERRIVMDEDLARGFDRSRYSVEDVRALNLKCRQKESTIAKSLAYAGISWPGIVAWDDMRTVDYLITRPEVDPKRIGCVGVSMGGYRSLLLSGLDDRIAAGCVTGFLSTIRPMIRRHMDTHSFVHFIPEIHRSLDLPDIVAMRAPKPLLVQQCRRDRLFPLAGMEEGVAKIAAIYKKAGAPDAFTSRFYDVPHIFNIQMQNDAFDWFDRHFQ